MAASTHARGRATTAFQPVTSTEPGNLIVVTASYSVTARISANDVFQLVKIPNQARIEKVIFRGKGTVAGWTYTVGDGGSTNRFVTASSVSATLTNKENVKMVVGGYKYSFTPAATQWDTIDVKMTVVPATTATLNMSITVFYTMDLMPKSGVT